MLNIKEIQNNKDYVVKKLESRGFDISLIEEVSKLLIKRSNIMTELQELESERNALSREIGKAKASGQDDKGLLDQVAKVKEKIEPLSPYLDSLLEEINEKLLYIPNLPNDKTPIGKSEEDNIEIAEYGDIGRGKITNVKPHYEIGVEKDLIDFEDTVKLSGSRFWSYKGLGSMLVRALENYLLDTHVESGYEELRTPVLVNTQTLQGTGQLPKFKDDLFKIEGKDLWLIPTAEVTLTNFYANRILDLTKPIKLTGFTLCFRSEAGSGGKDMKGLIRAHQFNKVELVKITTKEQYDQEYNSLLDDVRKVLKDLELPFKEVQLCSGDIGFSSEETIDFEVWIPSENRYREISSVSKFSDFQARRSMLRYKENDKNVYAYTINGSGIAIDRAVAAILENHQNEDGTINIPKVLIPYMGIDKI